MDELVLILMATYNGENYLAEQIQSIQNQNYRDWQLIIQDDCSSDETINILKEFAIVDKRIKYFINESKDHGAYYNFHSLANRFKGKNEYQYFMFCDQDDIWNPDKIEIFLNSIRDYSDIPCLVYADMSICSADGKIIEQSMNRVFKMDHRTEYNVFFEHKVFGCNLMMNRRLFQLVPKLDLSKSYIKFLSHDNLYTKFAATFGIIKFLPIQTMRYRRHGDNVTSHVHYKISVIHLIKRLFEIKALAKDHTIIYNQSLVAISLIRRIALTKEQKDRLNKIESCIVRGGIYAIHYLNEQNIHWRRKTEEVSRRIILISGLYRQFLISDKERS